VTSRQSGREPAELPWDAVLHPDRLTLFVNDAGESWPVPLGVVSSDGYLVFDWPLDDVPARPNNYGEMLSGFASLAFDSNEAMLHYARQWGALGFPTDRWKPARESIAEWRSTARLVEAILNFGAALSRGLVPDAADREVLKGADRRIPWPTNQRVIDNPSWSDSLRLALHVNRLLALGQVTPEFRWDLSEEEPALELRAPTLLGGIALIIATTLAASSDRLYRCDACRSLFMAATKRQRGRRVYCSDPCRKKGATLRKREQRKQEQA
jgi:hypothetical protein